MLEMIQFWPIKSQPIEAFGHTTYKLCHAADLEYRGIACKVVNISNKISRLQREELWRSLNCYRLSGEVFVGQPKVLVVDDDQESRELISEVLASNGYTVGVVESAEAARALIDRGDEYRIVIADLQMPNASGLELLQELRRENRKLELILMSSFMGGAERKQAMELGVKGLLEKPFRLTELLRMVDGLASKTSIGIAP